MILLKLKDAKKLKADLAYALMIKDYEKVSKLVDIIKSLDVFDRKIFNKKEKGA